MAPTYHLQRVTGVSWYLDAARTWYCLLPPTSQRVTWHAGGCSDSRPTGWGVAEQMISSSSTSAPHHLLQQPEATTSTTRFRGLSGGGTSGSWLVRSRAAVSADAPYTRTHVWTTSGRISWCRLFNKRRYGTPFTHPSMAADWEALHVELEALTIAELKSRAAKLGVVPKGDNVRRILGSTCYAHHRGLWLGS